MKSRKHIKQETIVSIPRPGGHEEWIQFKCGSIYPAFMCKIPMQKTKGHNDGKRKCPKCFAQMISKIFTCSVCGISFLRTPRAPSDTKRCSTCQYDYGLERRAVANRRRYAECGPRPDKDPRWSRAKRAKDFLKSPRISPRSDCRYYLPECLIKAVFKNDPFVDCYSCDRYEKTELHAEISSNGGTFTETIFGCERGRL